MLEEPGHRNQIVSAKRGFVRCMKLGRQQPVQIDSGVIGNRLVEHPTPPRLEDALELPYCTIDVEVVEDTRPAHDVEDGIVELQLLGVAELKSGIISGESFPSGKLDRRLGDVDSDDPGAALGESE